MLGERGDAGQRRIRRKVPPAVGKRQMLGVPREDRRVQERITKIAEQVRREDWQDGPKEHRGDEEIGNGRNKRGHSQRATLRLQAMRGFLQYGSTHAFVQRGVVYGWGTGVFTTSSRN